jgi:uncharacterized membrane protein
MRPARRLTPGARARRALLIDVLAAVLLSVVALNVSAGLGVVGFFGLPLLILGLTWIAIERALSAIRRRRRRRESRYAWEGRPRAPESTG